MYRYLLIFLMAAVLVGCGSLSINPQSSGVTLLAQGVSMKYVERANGVDARRVRALALMEAVDDARVMLDWRGVTVADLKAAMIKRVMDADMELSDKVLLTEFIGMLASGVDDGVENGEVQPDERVTVNAVLDAVERGAMFYL